MSSGVCSSLEPGKYQLPEQEGGVRCDVHLRSSLVPWLYSSCQAVRTILVLAISSGLLMATSTSPSL